MVDVFDVQIWCLGLKGQLHSDGLVIGHTSLIQLEVADGDRMSYDQVQCVPLVVCRVVDMLEEV